MMRAYVVAWLVVWPAYGQFSAQPVASNLDSPIFATFAPGEPDKLYILERGGDIMALDLNTNTLSPFFTITGLNLSGEGGALGLAFHPDYASNGLIYANITSGSPMNTVIRQFTNSGGTVGSPVDILTFAQPQTNHNGGWIGFNPQATGPAANYLYIATGDGGGSDDNDAGHTAGTGNAQDITSNLLGKILRIDVGATGGSYTNPASNPFVGVTGDDEIFAYGLRNPFRASFDRDTGDLYIGDVGQGAREEIDRILGNSSGGENFGWRLREGTIATPSGGVGGAPPPGNVEPIYDYTRGSGAYQGNTVTGGVLYRGPGAALQGKYVFGDYGSDNLWLFDPADPYGTVTNINQQIAGYADIDNPVAFAEDTEGNLYVVDLGVFNQLGQVIEPGQVFRIDVLHPGDANGDGMVNLADLQILGDNWQSDTATWSEADFTGDGLVNLGDLQVLGDNWGHGVGPDARLVPEPGMVAMLLLAGPTALLRPGQAWRRLGVLAGRLENIACRRVNALLE
ncbi:MAG: PQQ-dependent sugar dehydrogenase [Phycisphaeraceae bacterium]|nr:PQQ-dependent sugar dehydrogenase [Phycisphaeraceae bacterium]